MRFVWTVWKSEIYYKGISICTVCESTTKCRTRHHTHRELLIHSRALVVQPLYALNVFVCEVARSRSDLRSICLVLLLALSPTRTCTSNRFDSLATQQFSNKYNETFYAHVCACWCASVCVVESLFDIFNFRIDRNDGPSTNRLNNSNNNNHTHIQIHSAYLSKHPYVFVASFDSLCVCVCVVDL